MNALTITGNLVAKPNLVELPNRNGNAEDTKQYLCNFRLANQELDRKGNRVLNGFFNVTAFGAQAYHAARAFQKGDRVLVSGRLTQEQWKDKETGEPRSRVKITAQTVAASLEFYGADLIRPKADPEPPTNTASTS